MRTPSYRITAGLPFAPSAIHGLLDEDPGGGGGGDDDKVTFADKKALGDYVTEKYAERDGKWKEKNAAGLQALELAKTLQQENADLKLAAAGAPSKTEAASAELAALKEQNQLLNTRLTTEETARGEMKAQLKETATKNALTELAAAAGMTKDALPNVLSLFPEKLYKVEESESGKITVTLTDDLGRKVDDNLASMKAWMPAWLQDADAAVGGGLPGAGPNRQKKQTTGDPLEGLSPNEAYRAAKKQRQDAGA